MLLIPLSIIALSLCLALLLLSSGKNKSTFRKIRIKKKKLSKKDDKKLVLYDFFSRIPVTSALIQRCLRTVNPSSKIKDRNKRTAVDSTVYSLVISLFVTLLASPFIANFRVLITASIALIFITVSSVDYFSGKANTKLLEHMVDFLDILRNKYFEAGNRVDDALLDTIQSLDMDRHRDIIDEAETLLETIEHPESELALRDYYQIAPNRYFILLAGLLFINKENGDLIDEKGSRFAKSLTDLSGELKEEIKLRDRLNFSLKSLNIIAILPLFVMSPLRLWASQSFYPMQKFYESSLGFLTEFSVLVSVVLSFIGISRIQSFREDLSRTENGEFFQTLYKKCKKVVDFIIPPKNSARYKKVRSRKERALEFSSLQVHYTKKVSACLLALILGTVISLYLSGISKRSILENPTLPEGYLGGEVSEEEMNRAIKRSEMDKRFLLFLLDDGDSSEVLKALETEYGLLGEQKKAAIERIIGKYKSYLSARFNHWDVLIIYLVSVLSFFLPDALLLIRRRVIRIDAMNEISKFQLICSLLLHIRQIGVDNLLEWLERFSVIFKNPLQEAIMDYDSGAELALKKLKACSENDDFRKLIEHMLSAVNRISIERAFEDLDSEKNYYRERRQTIYQRIVDKKISLGRMIGFIPTYSVILLYFMFPLVYSSTTEIDMYFKLFMK